VSAGSPTAPPSLKTQLAIGGRLVVPVGPEERHQDLIKITRKSDMDDEEENLDAFVPLIGQDGWADGTTAVGKCAFLLLIITRFSR
jgi:protein-L-isoaspartate O-methyltransferase